MTKESKWIIKVDRPVPRLMWVSGNKADADKQCAELNEHYQTTEYYVEEYDTIKALQLFTITEDEE